MNNDIWALSEFGDFGGLDAARPNRLSPLLAAKVMMVDDEPLMTDLVQTHLEEVGYRNFVVTNDPREALAMLRRELPAVLLLDLMMPQMSGFELLEAIRADRVLRYTPVLVLTAASGADAKLRALKLGASDFLSKPVDASELVLRLRNTLAFHQYHHRLANFDAATGLPNQRPFDAGLAELLLRRDLGGGLLALFSIVVPEWRRLHENLSPQSADLLMKALAGRLEAFAAAAGPRADLATSVERAPRLARLTGERFGLLIEGLPAPAVEPLARRLVAELSRPVTVGAHEICASVWIGIALAPADGDSADALRKSADLAASQSRGRGVSHYEFASPEMNESSYQQMALGLQLRGAARRGELVLHYQPKVALQGNRIDGAEALVRWNHPTLGLLPPARFIALAEEIGLVGDIGQWVLEQACRDAAAWRAAGLGALKIAVNVAKPQFQSGDFCSTVRQALFDSGLPAGLLVIELTESMLMTDVAAGLRQMQELKQLGVTLSIDDFGTGYSSLSYLKSFPLDELKIDRSFVTDLPGSTADVAIVRAVIELGHSLSMSVTAEGVETAGQLHCLQQLGCDTYQGYLYSRPVPVAEFLARLHGHAAAAAG